MPSLIGLRWQILAKSPRTSFVLQAGTPQNTRRQASSKSRIQLRNASVSF